MKKEYQGITKRLKDIGERFHLIRRNFFRQTQKNLAPRIGITQSQVSNIKRGNSGPSAEVFIKLSRLEINGERINMDWLITGKGSPTISLSDDNNADSELLNKFKFLSPKKRDAVLKILDTYLNP